MIQTIRRRIKGAKQMKLSANQIAFILDGLEFFDDDGDDYMSHDGTYHLTNQEIDELTQMLQTELEKLK